MDLKIVSEMHSKKIGSFDFFCLWKKCSFCCKFSNDNQTPAKDHLNTAFYQISCDNENQN